MGSLSKGQVRAALLMAAAAFGLVGCDAHAPIVVPSGAQVVHAVIDGGTVRLAPATAHAGEVYLVVDTPDTSLVFIQGMPAPEASAGPLSDEQIDALAGTGSTYHTSITCCYMNDPRGGASAKLALTAGKYVLLVDDPARALGPDLGPIPSGAMAVLEVAR
jgi:hypothetical protein